MVVIDSSVWIATLRKSDTPGVRKLRTLVRDADRTIIIGDVILMEVLQGARSERHSSLIEAEMRLYPVVAMLDADLAVSAARNYRTLRARGITVRRSADMIIGTFCIAGGHALLHENRDFRPMAAHLGLQEA